MLLSKLFNKTPMRNVILLYTKRKLASNMGKVIYVPKRNFTFNVFRKINPEKYKLIDKMPQGYELIYKCTLTSYLYAAQIIATVTVIIISFVLLFQRKPFQDFKIMYDAPLKNLKNQELQFFVFFISFLLFNLFATIIVQRFPVRIYFNNNLQHYKTFTHGIIPTTKSPLEFKVGDVKYAPKSEVILPWNSSRYQLKNGKIIFIFEHNFRKPNDMNIMMGYVK